MQLTQRQITMGVFGLVTLSALCLSGLYALRSDMTGLVAAGIGSVVAAALWFAYRNGWDYARHSVVLVAAILIPFALNGNALTGYVHPIIFFPAVLAVVLTTPRWIIGSALGAYLLLLLRAGWAGQYTHPEMILSYLIIVSGLVVSRLATDTAQRLADANERAEAERLRAEAALAEAAKQTTALAEALSTVAEREAALAGTVAELQASETTVRELSAPILPILPGVLVAPLVGTLDSRRAALFARNLLDAIERQHANRVIFDITGVPVVDSQVAQTLLQAAAAAGLLGAQVALVGIRPEVAQTLVALGVALETMTPYSDLQEAVRAFGGPARQQRAL
jgi:rsbT co-antagonist protein RsbR